jgi:hypothetical protein
MKILEKKEEYLQKLKICEMIVLEKLVQKIEKVLENRKPLFDVGDILANKVASSSSDEIVWEIVSTGIGKDGKTNEYELCAKRSFCLLQNSIQTRSEKSILNSLLQGSLKLCKDEQRTSMKKNRKTQKS